MKNLKIVLLTLFIISFSFCIYKILSFIIEDKAAEDLKKKLKEQVDISNVSEETTHVLIDFEELKKINSDVVGWIVIEGTQINYPIVKGKDNIYYLKHSFYKKNSNYGTIYMDARANNDFTSKNTFIYGHYTANKKMFGELGNYLKQSFYENHNKIYLYTPTKNYIVKIFSAYIENALSDSYQMDFTEKAYKDYLELIKRKSLIHSNIKIDYTTDRIVTLYSCIPNTTDENQKRYYVHGKIIELGY